MLMFLSLSLVVCLPSSLDTSRGYFSWTETFPEEFATTECERGVTTRFCSKTGVWEKPVTEDCYVSTNELFRYIERVCGTLRSTGMRTVHGLSSVPLSSQHGFSEDNLRELLFAVNQLLREDEVASERYVRIVRQILREFMREVNANRQEVEEEVSHSQRLM
jgi:hypothetical protein